VTDLTRRIVVPVGVASHAVAVVRALESGLGNVLVRDVRRVTVLAGGMLRARGSKVMACLASAAEPRHLGVGLVIKHDGFIELHDSVEDNDPRTGVGAQVGHLFVPSTKPSLQAGMLGRRERTRVTLRAVDMVLSGMSSLCRARDNHG
jgi:hypothetical protein